MIRANTRPRKRNSGRPPHKVARGYLQWLRGRECVMAFNCDGGIEAAHVDYAGDKGVATKVSDCHALPMCAKHHREQHSIGWTAFERRYGNFNALEVSAQYWRNWPGRIAWERKLEASRG